MTTPAAAEEAPDTRTGERAHMLMWRLGLTQTEVGRRLRLDSTALGRKLRGIRPWYLREIVTLADVLDTSVGYLIGETDDPRPPVLPRLDSNQQPSDIRSLLVPLLRNRMTWRAPRVSRPLPSRIAPVIPLASRRAADPNNAGRAVESKSA